MNYSVVVPPFSLDFRTMNRKDLAAYKKWFMSLVHTRPRVLATAVNQTPGYENWLPDFTPDSLDLLGEWFVARVTTRPRTEEEIEAHISRMVFRDMVSKEELTQETLSVAFDIGIYLSQVFLKAYPTLRWVQDVRRKSNVDYGQLALAGFQFSNFNPIRMVLVYTYGVKEKTKTGKRLRSLYELWAKDLNSQLN